MIEDFAILLMVFVIGLVAGCVLGAAFCTAAREEAIDATEHGATPL